MYSIFGAYVVNKSLHNEGYELGEWIRFPTTDTAISQTLKQIQVDGIEYETHFILEYDSDIQGITRELGEYENLRELNFLAERLEELEQTGDLKKLEAVISLASCHNAKDLINLTYNLDNFDYWEGIKNEQELGEYLVNESGYDTMLDKLREQFPKHIGDYLTFNEEAIGTDFCCSNNCIFVNTGFVMGNDSNNIEYYRGIEDLEPLEKPYDMTME